MNPEGGEGGSKLQVPIKVSFFMTLFLTVGRQRNVTTFGTMQLRFTRSGSLASYFMCVKKCLMPFDSKRAPRSCYHINESSEGEIPEQICEVTPRLVISASGAQLCQPLRCPCIINHP